MTKYRIKIEELNNGLKYHEPQVSKCFRLFGLTINFGWFSKWWNIDACGKEISHIVSFKVEEDALECIKRHKFETIISLGKDVKKITYKNIIKMEKSYKIEPITSVPTEMKYEVIECSIKFEEGLDTLFKTNKKTIYTGGISDCYALIKSIEEGYLSYE